MCVCGIDDRYIYICHGRKPNLLPVESPIGVSNSRNFQIFAKNGKTQICFYLLNHAR